MEWLLFEYYSVWNSLLYDQKVANIVVAANTMFSKLYSFQQEEIVIKKEQWC